MPVLLISLLLAPLLWAGGLGAQSAEFRDRVGQALDDARPALMGHLAQSCGKHVRPGQLALVMLAAIDDGVERTDPVFERAVARLAKANCNQTYDLALRLMVVQALPDFPDRVEIAKDDLDRLLDEEPNGTAGTREEDEEHREHGKTTRHAEPLCQHVDDRIEDVGESDRDDERADDLAKPVTRDQQEEQADREQHEDAPSFPTAQRSGVVAGRIRFGIVGDAPGQLFSSSHGTRTR